MNQRTSNNLPNSINVSSAKVFISYAEGDFETAKRLYDDLQKAGLVPWMANADLLAGQKRWQTIAKTIRESDFFIAVLSENSLSKRGEAQKQLNAALDFLDEFAQDDIFVLPVRVDDCKPVHLKLADRQWVDLFPSYEEGLNKILRAMEVHLPAKSP